MTRWDKSNDTTLYDLLDRGDANPDDLSNDTIAKVHKKSFSEFPYKNFAANYRKKVRKWNIENTLAGKREFFSVVVVVVVAFFVCLPLHTILLANSFIFLPQVLNQTRGELLTPTPASKTRAKLLPPGFKTRQKKKSTTRTP